MKNALLYGILNNYLKDFDQKKEVETDTSELQKI